MKIGKFLPVFLILAVLLLSSCGARHHVVTRKENRNIAENSSASANSEIVSKIVKNAKRFEGTRYKYGGTGKRGMDCSGLIYVSFLEEDISLPRTARAMSLQGERLIPEGGKRG